MNYRIDNLQYCNWSRDIFEINKEAGLNAVHALSYGTPVGTHNNFYKQMPEAAIIEDQKTGFFFNENDSDDLSLNIDLWFSKFDINLTQAERRRIIDEKYNPEYQNTNGQGEIIYQYYEIHDVDDGRIGKNGNRSSIGIESPDQNQGIQYLLKWIYAYLIENPNLVSLNQINDNYQLDSGEHFSLQSKKSMSTELKYPIDTFPIHSRINFLSNFSTKKKVLFCSNQEYYIL